MYDVNVMSCRVVSYRCRTRGRLAASWRQAGGGNGGWLAGNGGGGGRRRRSWLAAWQPGSLAGWQPVCLPGCLRRHTVAPPRTRAANTESDTAESESESESESEFEFESGSEFESDSGLDSDCESEFESESESESESNNSDADFGIDSNNSAAHHATQRNACPPPSLGPWSPPVACLRFAACGVACGGV